MRHERAVAEAMDHQAFVWSALSDLTGERAYIFGLLLYERLVAVAQQTSPTGLGPGVPHEEVEVVLEALWDRLSHGRSNPLLDRATSDWLLDGSQPGAVESILTEKPEVFNLVSISWTPSASRAALNMCNDMTSAVPIKLWPVEFAAEREALEALRVEDRLDLTLLRARAREVGRQLAGLGMA